MKLYFTHDNAIILSKYNKIIYRYDTNLAEFGPYNHENFSQNIKSMEYMWMSASGVPGSVATSVIDVKWAGFH